MYLVPVLEHEAAGRCYMAYEVEEDREGIHIAVVIDTGNAVGL
jgi:hypothetical protein